MAPKSQGGRQESPNSAPMPKVLHRILQDAYTEVNHNKLWAFIQKSPPHLRKVKKNHADETKLASALYAMVQDYNHHAKQVGANAKGAATKKKEGAKVKFSEIYLATPHRRLYHARRYNCQADQSSRLSHEDEERHVHNYSGRTLPADRPHKRSQH